MTYTQRDFSGVEFSPKLLMKAGNEVYARSVLRMVNYIPTPQGTALRSPGTRFLDVLDDPDARVFPYLTPSNKRALIVLRDTSARVYDNIIELIEGENSSTSGTSGIVTFRKNIINNFAFQRGIEDWVGNPNAYFGGRDEGPLGVYPDENLNFIWLVPRRNVDFLFRTV